MIGAVAALAIVLALSPAAVRGTATYYDTGPGPGYAAAGTELRHALGPDWRGSRVRVCGTGCVTVKLIDTCGCPGARIIDLDPVDFSKVGRLRDGVVPVTIREVGRIAPTVTLPPTHALVATASARPGRLAL